MTAFSASQKVTIVSVSTATLATATVAAYYMYRRSRNQPHAQPSAHSLPASVPSSTHDVRPDPVPTNSFAWAVYWDIENIQVPKNVSVTHFVQALRHTLASHRNRTQPDSILHIHAIADLRRLPRKIRDHLEANGVKVTHVRSVGRKDVADKALITELCLLTRERPAPFGICLISGDGDFAYPISRLAALGYTSVLIAPSRSSFSNRLELTPAAVIPLRTLLQPSNNSPAEPESERVPHPVVIRSSTSVVPLQHPIHLPRPVNRRTERRRRRNRPVILLSPTGDEDTNRPWASDDEAKSSISLGTGRHVDQFNQLPFRLTQHDSHVAIGSFDSSLHVDTVISLDTPPQFLPLPQRQIQIPGSARRRVDHLMHENGSRARRRQSDESRFHSSSRTEDRTEDRTESRTVVSTRGNLDGVRIPRNEPKQMESGTRVHFGEAIIVPDREQNDRKYSPFQHDSRKNNGTSREELGTSFSSSLKRGRRSQQILTTDSTNNSKLFLRNEMRWLYCGTKALPSMILLLVLGLSLLLTSLRTVIAVMEDL